LLSFVLLFGIDPNRSLNHVLPNAQFAWIAYVKTLFRQLRARIAHQAP
jgi:hypothetical protein